MAGVETTLPLIYSAGVCTGRLSLERFVQVWTEGPARALGLYPRKGVIAIGSDADLVLFDPSAKWVLKAQDLHMNSDCLPFEGREVSGKPVVTVLRGRLLVQDGKLQSPEPFGELVPRHFA